MTKNAILTLTTDFGHEGPYVATVKGVILGLVPDVQLVDVTHTITPQNVLEGSFVLGALVEAFPAGTVHLGVVDHGLGTDRRLIAVSIAEQWFVLPDNGLITAVARGRTPTGTWEIANPRIRRKTVAPTLHGRDILAPAAAHLLLGRDPAELGPARTRFATIRNVDATANENGFVGEVILRDRFGNLITNIASERLGNAPAGGWQIEIAGARIEGLAQTYGEHPPGTLIALPGSTGWVEIAVVNGDAGRQLTAGPGTTVWLTRAAPH